MSWYRKVLIFILLSSFLVIPKGAPKAQDGWVQIGNGIEFQQFSLPDPIQVFVARMDRLNPAVTLEAALAGGRVTYARETVSKMAERYDESLSSWGGTWGSRSNVIVAINGSFIDTNTGQALSGIVQSGWYAKRFDELGGGSGFSWTSDRTAFVGGCVDHREERQFVSFPSSQVGVTIAGINVPRAENQLVLYTHQYHTTTLTGSDGVEVLVELTQPAGIVPSPNSVLGYVREIRDGQGSSPIPFDHVVLSATGIARQALLDHAHVGGAVGISQEITHFEKDCATPNAESWSKTYTSISGSFEYLRDGLIQSFDDRGATAAHPRTAVAFNDTHVFFIVVDGRAPGWSEGMTIDELAVFSLDVLGATWGVAQDGGGSSTMVVNGKVVNRPAVPCEKQYLPLIINGREVEIQPRPSQSAPTSGPAAGLICQRPVANGLMMVEVLPPEMSTKFQPTNLVITTAPVDLRLGPGWNYSSYVSLPRFMPGMVLDHMNNLEGVYAQGSYWWKVTFEGISGWVPEQSLHRSVLRKLPRINPK